MKQFMNSKETLVTEALDGLIRASNGRLARLDGYPHIKVAIGLATLQQIFLNLLQNAMDVIDAHVTEDRWIEIFGNMDHETRMLRIGVSNAGPKIDPLLARQIFERGFSTKGRRGSGRA